MPYADPVAQREYQRQWAASRRAHLLGEYAECMKCGAIDRLEFHHFVKSEKVSHRFTTWAPARAKAEAAKCWILCKPCHAALHADERRAPCGTASAYRRGCRCERCRAAKRAARVREGAA
jgi:5-methylcytosine-specific restriction endonuclease McrA